MSNILLATTVNYQKHGSLPLHVLHPFASAAEESCLSLQHLIGATDHLASSLALYATTTISNPKLVSLLRQHASIAHTLHQLDRGTCQVIDTLQGQSRLKFGEDVPSNPSAVVEWCISRLETWGTSIGMETFKDDKRGGGISLVLGGKVLVIDVDLTVDITVPSVPKLIVASVKTSFAIPNAATGMPSNGGSPALDSFLHRTIELFCLEVQKPAETRDLRLAARLGADVFEQLRYLVLLDKLAASKEGGGLRWFGAVDELYPSLETFAKREGEVVASSLSATRTPLDLFLMRAHALPLPYLLSPSISFLIHIPPSSYLTLLRSNDTESSKDSSLGPRLDVSIHSLRTYLHRRPKGAVIATLVLLAKSAAHIFPVSMSMPNFTSRPTFSLIPQGSELEYALPQVVDLANAVTYETDASSSQHTWYLDFTNGGRNPGITMSQHRMREVELIVNPLGGIHAFDTVGMMSFGSGSWVNLLLNSDLTKPPERYSTLYTSPKALHPPLHLHLTVPEEPGFRLERVPVHNMKEVWGIMEVVREQCWLNEILIGCHWAAEGQQSEYREIAKEPEATEEELQAILAGNVTPNKIPVNIFLPSPSTSFPDIDSMGISQATHRGPRIVMTSPERPPISGLVEITVTFDETRPRGVSVNVSGAMGADIRPEALEEICRRGGTLGLSGRVWSKAHGPLC